LLDRLALFRVLCPLSHQAMCEAPRSPLRTPKAQMDWIRNTATPLRSLSPQPGLSPQASTFPRLSQGSFSRLAPSPLPVTSRGVSDGARLAPSPLPVTSRAGSALRGRGSSRSPGPPSAIPKCTSLEVRATADEYRRYSSPLPRAYSTFLGQRQLARVVNYYDTAPGGGGSGGGSYHLGGGGSYHLDARSTWAQVRPQGPSGEPFPAVAPGPVTRPPTRMPSQTSEDMEAPEYSEPSSDLGGLLEFFEGLKRRGELLTEVTYVVNGWSLAGVIPLWHHGFIVRTQESGYLTLDFSRRGILWDTFETYPDLPDSTIFSKKYKVGVDPAALKKYCEDTRPFSWPGNDCAHWAKGVMAVMRIPDDPLDNRGCFRKHTTADCLACPGSPSSFVGCFS